MGHDENKHTKNGTNQKIKEYSRISFKPSELEKHHEAPSSNIIPVEKEAEQVALKHGNFQAKKLESSLDNLSASILKQSDRNLKNGKTPVSSTTISPPAVDIDLGVDTKKDATTTVDKIIEEKEV